MAARGRQSAASLSIATVSMVQRMEAPSELTAREKPVWRTIVDTKPADWFTPGDAPLLVDYCRHICRQRDIAKALKQYPDVPTEEKDFNRYRALIQDSDRLSKTMKTIAVALRLTQQSRYTPGAAATATKKQQRKPWES